MDHATHELMRRIAALEAENRRVRLGGFLVLTLLLLTWGRSGASQRVGGELAAPFRVVSPEGKVVFEVAADRGNSRVVLMNTQGKPTVSLSSDSHGGLVSVGKADGVRVASLAAAPEGAYLALADSGEHDRVYLSSNRQGGLVTLTGQSRGRLRLDTEEGGRPRLTMQARSSGLDVALESTDRGGSLRLASQVPGNRQTGVRTTEALLQTTPNRAALELYQGVSDDRGKPPVLLGASDQGGQISVRDAGGRTVLHRP